MTNTTTAHLPLGFRAAGVAAHIKKTGAPDLALIVSDRDCTAAALFTTNKVKAAPVLRDMALMQTHATSLRAVIINSGCANACTGEQGMQDVSETARCVAEALGNGLQAAQVFVMSTGVIGVTLPMDKLCAGVPLAARELDAAGLGHAARAIMTTDTQPKTAFFQGQIDGQTCTITGMCKG